jgi:hypothetical protein
MNQRARELAERLTTFNNEMIALVEDCSEGNWRKICSGEEWTVGVVARHIAAGHYGALDLVKMIVTGETLPDLSMEAINQMNAQHAQEHSACTKTEVIGLLRENGASFAGYVAGLSDTDLDRTGYLAAIGGDISSQQLIENVILNSAGEHLANIRATTGS